MNLLDFLFPKRCLGCGKIGRYFCLNCRKGIHFVAFNESICPVCEKPAIDGQTHPRCRTRYSPDGLTSFFHYDGIVKKAVKALKYRFIFDLAAEFVSLIPEAMFDALKPDSSTLVPIPLHASRLRGRGFNQAEVLASSLSRRLNIKQSHDILRRDKKTDPQVEMRHRKERLKNMDGVFAIQQEIEGRRMSILLFDDVFTTGATMRSAANVLKRAGIKRVWAVTMAR